ncbi:hypothetical protein [Leptospira hartskeerlii]|uniref:hypothetical protein n=1 Tax=Leptospira hartskeerlii TaxID=2023177 RepID=UPI001FB04A39|nr:hypothetical protein [Leptospira hartskeerlii]
MKYENAGKSFRGFIGFLQENSFDFPEELEEAEIETGKYLKLGNSSVIDQVRAQLYIDRRIQKYLDENNIKTDRMKFCSGRNLYLRIIN